MYMYTYIIYTYNIFIDRVGKDLVVKVADFGLSRDIYSDEYYRLRHKAAVPIKWMSPESLYDGYFNQKTDVVCISEFDTCLLSCLDITC